MTFNASKIFRAYLADVLDNTTAMDVGADTFKCALYPDTITPDQNVASASTAHGSGQWATDIFDGTNWDDGGEPLASVTLNSATSATVFMDANDTAQGGATCTLTGVYGCQIYDDTITTPVADQGVCYLYFGGPQGVTAGTFTVVYHTNGIFRFTL